MMKTGDHFDRGWVMRSTFGLLLATGFVSVFAVDCGGGASCDGVCSNVLDKCTTQSDLTSDNLARNQCLEQCTTRIQTVPDSCALERDALLSCLSDAPSLDCTDAQKSAACSKENAAILKCVGTTTVGSGSAVTSVGSGGGGTACMQDKVCSTGLCNTKLQVCGTAGALDAPCYRDSECANGLCNTKLDQCAAAGGAGAGCYRDSECANGLCNTKLDQCAPAQALGGPCYRDSECGNALCNTKLDQCANAGAAGSPCYRASECQSGNCGSGDTCG